MPKPRFSYKFHCVIHDKENTDTIILDRKYRDIDEMLLDVYETHDIKIASKNTVHRIINQYFKKSSFSNITIIKIDEPVPHKVETIITFGDERYQAIKTIVNNDNVEYYNNNFKPVNV